MIETTVDWDKKYTENQQLDVIARAVNIGLIGLLHKMGVQCNTFDPSSDDEIGVMARVKFIETEDRHGFSFSIEGFKNES